MPIIQATTFSHLFAFGLAIYHWTFGSTLWPVWPLSPVGCLWAKIGKDLNFVERKLLAWSQIERDDFRRHRIRTCKLAHQWIWIFLGLIRGQKLFLIIFRSTLWPLTYTLRKGSPYLLRCWCYWAFGTWFAPELMAVFPSRWPLWWFSSSDSKSWCSRRVWLLWSPATALTAFLRQIYHQRATSQTLVHGHWCARFVSHFEQRCTDLENWINSCDKRSIV